MKFQLKHTRAAKLTLADVRSIRRKWGSGAWTQSALCREYGVTINTIGRIVRGESWADVESDASTEEVQEMGIRMAREAISAEQYSRLDREIQERIIAPRKAADDILAGLADLPVSPESAARAALLKGEASVKIAIHTDHGSNQGEGPEASDGVDSEPPDAGYTERADDPPSER